MLLNIHIAARVLGSGRPFLQQAFGLLGRVCVYAFRGVVSVGGALVKREVLAGTAAIPFAETGCRSSGCVRGNGESSGEAERGGR